MKKKKYILVALFTVFMLGGLYAQPSGTGDSGGPTDAGAGAPIDGGIISLIVLGSAYGIKKYNRSES